MMDDDVMMGRVEAHSQRIQVSSAPAVKAASSASAAVTSSSTSTTSPKKLATSDTFDGFVHITTPNFSASIITESDEEEIDHIGSWADERGSPVKDDTACFSNAFSDDSRGYEEVCEERLALPDNIIDIEMLQQQVEVVPGDASVARDAAMVVKSLGEMLQRVWEVLSQSLSCALKALSSLLGGGADEEAEKQAQTDARGRYVLSFLSMLLLVGVWSATGLNQEVAHAYLNYVFSYVGKLFQTLW